MSSPALILQCKGFTFLQGQPVHKWFRQELRATEQTWQAFLDECFKVIMIHRLWSLPILNVIDAQRPQASPTTCALAKSTDTSSADIAKRIDDLLAALWTDNPVLCSSEGGWVIEAWTNVQGSKLR